MSAARFYASCLLCSLLQNVQVLTYAACNFIYSYGYPDDQYLRRVIDDLHARGIR